MDNTELRLKFNHHAKSIYNYFANTSTFSKTLKLSVLYVFLFYLPFTIASLFFNEAIFFQLDYVYQFSTIIFDFRNRLMNFDFSSWDFKNGLGYDYFANFYYIPLDITLLPYFLFPFLSYSQLMWLSFLFKVLLGTACFSYLLKLYKLDHKTILLVSVLYGTADLFFAQNVFASYSGLIIYIPLILIAIELMFQKKNFLVFSLVFFQVFLFNYYWAWNLSLFMAISLLGRAIFTFFTMKNLLTFTPYKKTLIFIGKSIAFYMLGLGMAAFFLFPTYLGIMKNEPRMENSILDIFIRLKTQYGPMVYFKVFFKSFVPNLYMYCGYFWDQIKSINWEQYTGFFWNSEKNHYWLTTNHVIIYSSILATFSLFFVIFYPLSFVKKKLDEKKYKIFITLKVVNIIAIVLVLWPFTSYLFSFNSGPYLRWLVFYGFLMIINFAFVYEYKLFNKHLFASFLVIAIGFLIFSIKFNQDYTSQYLAIEGKYPNSFISTDENVAIIMIIAYIVMIALMILLNDFFELRYFLIAERIFGIFLIFMVCTSTGFTAGVKHTDTYGKEINKMMQNIELDSYYTFTDFLFFNDIESTDTMQNMAYLFEFPVYSNLNIFHSLVNPHFSFYMVGHTRYLRTLEVPYLYYYYMDPSITIISNDLDKEIKNGMYDPEMELVARKDFPELNTYLSIYKREPQFSIGNGFTRYYSFDYQAGRNLFGFDFLWMNSFYVSDEEIERILKNEGFSETKLSFVYTRILERLEYTVDNPETILPNYNGTYYPYTFNITREDTEAVIFGGTPNNAIAFSVDANGKMERCYNKFCFVPKEGLATIYINHDNPAFYTINKDFLEEAVRDIKKYSAYDVQIEEDHIKSKVDNDKPIIMTYKVGYAPGWSVYVDNKKVETFPSSSGQLSFIIKEPGTHNIEFKYETPYLKLGIYVSIASTLVFSGLVYYKIRRGKKCLNLLKK